ncbi:MAG: hypothetical protein FWE47_02000 [Oscillospiraceae bacterium]|nr:hypothetical protein [Oscillospiraceae bacterium]
MSLFFEFFYELMVLILKNVVEFFQTLGNAFWNAGASFSTYVGIIKIYFPQFDTTAWILGVLSIIMIVALFALLVWFILKALKKYFAFRKRMVEEEELMKEITRLNHEVAALLDEKNKIMAMKVSQLGLKPGEEEGEEGDGEEEAIDPNGGISRFVRLIDVDKKYEENPFKITTPQKFTLSELVERYRNFACKKMNLYYPRELVMAFVAGMASSRLIILEGISGTGKTSLPYSWGKFLKRDSCVCAVQPSWRDRTELVGYLNEFTKRFNESEFLEGIYEFTYRDDIGFVVLDEMNLARVEYYFAEILSVLELPNSDEWIIDVVPDSWPSDPKNVINGRMKLPTNLWFVGTANNDDSTFSITDKVYDRAIPIQIDTKIAEFECEDSEPMQIESAYLQKLFAEAKKTHPVSDEIFEKLEALDYFVIENFRLSFGNRIVKQMRDFIPVYVACGGTEIGGLDYMFTYKVLKKFEGLNLMLLKDSMKKLISYLEKLFGRDNMPYAKAFLERLIKMAS